MPPKVLSFGGILFMRRIIYFNKQREDYSIKGYATLLTKSLH